MLSESTFNIFLILMAIAGLVVYIALHYINAGYGILYTKKWGISVNNKLGWILMEAPVVIIMCLLWWFSSRKYETAPLVIFLIFQLHYVQRSFIFPLLLRGKSKMPITIILSGITFNILNAIMQGGWIFYVSPDGRYPDSWLLSPQFLIGSIIFLIGMFINLQSDYIIRNLRKPGDTNHYIPQGGMFKYVSSANYFGEFIEWVGFAVLTWSLAGAVFAWWTFANLAPRAKKINKRYLYEFGNEFKKLNIRSIIPFIY